MPIESCRRDCLPPSPPAPPYSLLHLADGMESEKLEEAAAEAQGVASEQQTAQPPSSTEQQIAPQPSVAEVQAQL